LFVADDRPEPHYLTNVDADDDHDRRLLAEK
jgi:hypothetical protein